MPVKFYQKKTNHEKILSKMVKQVYFSEYSISFFDPKLEI